MLAVFDGRPCAPVVAEGGIFSDKGVACADFAACAGQVINRIVQAVRRGLQRIVIPNLLIVDMLMDRSPVRVERLFFDAGHGIGCLDFCAALCFCEPAGERIAFPAQDGKLSVGTAPGYLSGTRSPVGIGVPLGSNLTVQKSRTVNLTAFERPAL